MNLSEKNIKKFNENLLAWYDENKKPLPWRETTNPYNIWISEIMSQQTQVETVMPYYERFMKKYPDVATLAVADDAELLKLWEGLGYYSRVRNLKLAAQQIMTEFEGIFPSVLTDILSLKGVGPYTAAAIASISFSLAEPAIDGNLMRVTSRLFELTDDISKSGSRKIFDQHLRKLISADRPGDFNQALMDLGSKVCTPKVAKCEVCPIRIYCEAYAHGTPLNFPVKTKKLKQKDLYFVAVALQNSLGEYYLEKRPATGLLANMWTFPLSVLTENEFGQVITDGAVSKLPDLPKTISKTEYIGNFTHIFSHQKWHIAIMKAVPEEKFEVAENFLSADKMWLTDLSAIPLAGPQIKMFEILGK
ncbi:MAG: A/G-specific adenine glycosylase [Streptococcaceae bacterium]|nr:A/G-specific adenine glycosylase [Streptococcaceae bacterium]